MTKIWIYGVTTGDDLEVPRRDHTNFPRYNGGSQYWRYDSVSTIHKCLLKWIYSPAYVVPHLKLLQSENHPRQACQTLGRAL